MNIKTITMKCKIITKIIKIIKDKKLERKKLKYFNNYFKTNYDDLNNLKWYEISLDEKLSEEFIEIFQDEVEWDYISRYQTLSEGFIQEFKHKVHWDYFL